MFVCSICMHKASSLVAYVIGPPPRLLGARQRGEALPPSAPPSVRNPLFVLAAAPLSSFASSEKVRAITKAGGNSEPKSGPGDFAAPQFHADLKLFRMEDARMGGRTVEGPRDRDLAELGRLDKRGH